MTVLCGATKGHAVITSEQLRMGRAALKLTKKELAAASGVSVATIQRWETGAGRGRWVNEVEERLETTLRERGVVFIDGGCIYRPDPE